MALVAVDAFLELIRKSGLVEPNRLSAYLEKLRASPEYTNDPGKFAGLMVRDAILTTFQAEFLLTGKWRGFYVGKYKLLERLGQGGMGTVYLAEHKIMKRRVAIKVLPKSKSRDSSSLERFYREAKAIAALDHPNIVRAYDIDHDPESEVHFLVMEYVDGASLQDIVKGHGRIGLEQATNCIAQSALAMQHAHEIGIVHRDIKPGNILIDRYGVVKVLDMGLARFFHDEEDMLTRKYDENVLGTADYLAPEQALDSHTVDIRADIYALGCTMYFILAGKSPFGEGTVAQKLIWHQTRKPKPLTEWRPDVPVDLVNIIDKMMAKAPADRYQEPVEIVDALAPWNEQVLGPPPLEWMPVLSPAAGGPVPESSLAMSTSTTPTTLRSRPGSAALAGSSTARPLAAATGSPGSAGAKTGPPPGSHATPRPQIAATTQNAPGGAAGTRTPGFDSGSGGPRRPAGSGATEPRSGGAHHGKVKVPNSTVAAQARATRVEPPTISPAPAEDSSPWQEFTDTDSPSASVHDTIRSGRRRGRRDHLSGSRWDDPAFRRLALIVGGIASAVLLASALAVYVIWFRGPLGSVPRGSGGGREAEKQVSRSDTFYVSKSRVDANDFDTIEAAIRRAGPMDHILVRDQDVYEERLEISVLNNKRGLTLEAVKDADGNTATIRAPSNLPAGEPLIAVDRVEGFHLKGFNLDGARRCDEMIRVTGNSAGTTLEELRIKGFNRAGIHFEAVQGLPGKAVLVRDIWLESGRDKNQPADAAFYFSQPPRLTGRSNENIAIQQCQVLGPFNQAVRFNTTIFKVAFDHCVFHGGGKQGLVYPSVAPADFIIDIRLDNNTFSGYESVLDFQQQPNFLRSNVSLSGNLFYQITQGIIVLRSDFAEKLPDVIKGDDNYCNSTSKPGQANATALPYLRLQALDFQLPIKSPTAGDFLRFPKNHPLASAAKDKSFVGALEPLP